MQLEIHMLPTTNSVLVRIPSEFIREKVLLKRFWYVETSMFHVSQWSEAAASTTPSLQRIQLWAHLKGVPFDLIYDEGLSHIAGQIGEPKETDDWTLNLSSVSVAHVKVEVYTSIPLPTIVEVGRSDGSFVNVEVKYPWVPPICAHCKELGHISRNCPLLPEPPNTAPKPVSQSKEPPPSKIVCYSCKAPGHLMKNCPKGPKEWIEVSRRKTLVGEPAVESQVETSEMAIDPLPPSGEPTVVASAPPADSSAEPKSPIPSSPMELDPSSASPILISPQPEIDPLSPIPLQNCVLGLAAVCPSRPVIIQNKTLGLKFPSNSHKKPTSLNPFQILSLPESSSPPPLSSSAPPQKALPLTTFSSIDPTPNPSPNLLPPNLLLPAPEPSLPDLGRDTPSL